MMVGRRLNNIILVGLLVLCSPLGVTSRRARSPGVVAKIEAPQATTPESQVSVEVKRIGPKTTILNPPPPAAKELTQNTAVRVGMLLAFNSGFSNGVCLGGGVVGGQGSNAVAAVTGAWTTSALGLAGGDKTAFLSNAYGILSYFAGSLIAGLMIPNTKPFKIADGTGSTFMIGANIMYLASQMAEKAPTSKACFYLALMANGLQNSVTSVHTANLCRSAHFSGITSDMGTFLGQCLRGNKANLFKLKVFGLLAISFWLGGYSSFFVTQKMTSQSLLFCAAAHALIGGALMLKKGDEPRPFILDYII